MKSILSAGCFRLMIPCLVLIALTLPHFAIGSSVSTDSQSNANLQLDDPVLLEERCHSGDVLSCNRLSYKYQQGKDVEQSDVKAVEFYRLACQRNDPHGCTNLGYAYLIGSGVAVDYGKARELFKPVCESETILYSCFYYGQIYLNGLGITQDNVIAAETFKYACDKGDPYSCNAIADIYQYGRGTEINIDLAAKSYGIACDANLGFACYALARMYLTEETLHKDFTDAVPLLEKSCYSDSLQGCYDLSQLYFFGHKSIERNKQKSFELIRHYCNIAEKQKGNFWGSFYDCQNLQAQIDRLDAIEDIDALKKQLNEAH
jgi:TPR repeat protein